MNKYLKTYIRNRGIALKTSKDMMGYELPYIQIDKNEYFNNIQYSYDAHAYLISSTDNLSQLLDDMGDYFNTRYINKLLIRYDDPKEYIRIMLEKKGHDIMEKITLDEIKVLIAKQKNTDEFIKFILSYPSFKNNREYMQIFLFLFLKANDVFQIFNEDYLEKLSTLQSRHFTNIFLNYDVGDSQINIFLKNKEFISFINNEMVLHHIMRLYNPEIIFNYMSRKKFEKLNDSSFDEADVNYFISYAVNKPKMVEFLLNLPKFISDLRVNTTSSVLRYAEDKDGTINKLLSNPEYVKHMNTYTFNVMTNYHSNEKELFQKVKKLRPDLYIEL
jgi:hypothetical protein